MALTFTSPAAATAANVIMTPTTVPSRPRNGPPEIAIVSSTIWLLSRCLSRTSPPSSDARIAWIERAESTRGLRSATSHWRKQTSIFAAPRPSLRRCAALRSAHESRPLSSASKAMPRCADLANEGLAATLPVNP